MTTDVRTMNLSDNGDGMVPLNNNQGTSFVPNIPPEKNVSENKELSPVHLVWYLEKLHLIQSL